MSLGGVCKRNEGNLQRKRGRKKASYLLNYSFAPDKTFRFVLSMLKSIRKTLRYTQELWGCTTSHLPNLDMVNCSFLYPYHQAFPLLHCHSKDISTKICYFLLSLCLVFVIQKSHENKFDPRKYHERLTVKRKKILLAICIER